MPSSFNGIGTMYYGKREPGSDGSYVTTEWVTFAWVPLVPLRSYRVRPTGEGSSGWYLIASTSSQGYLVQREPLNWRQVRNVYSVVGGLVVLLGLVITFG